MPDDKPRFGQGIGKEFKAGRCGVHAQRLIRIAITGEEHPEGFPHARVDDGLVAEFVDWLYNEAHIYTVPCAAGVSGPGQYVGYFNEDVGREVLEWLEQKAKEKKDDEG